MKVEILHAESNIEYLLIDRINEKLTDWGLKHPNAEIMHVNQKITFVPDIGCPNLLLTLVIVYR